ncbi:MAG: peptide-methionine (S)-S-oxide reductase MsrA [Candidatus Levybacteria bacterium]|nr:peptide-methionine (S)-S-oxide reductase MsrA [Candidatus Levybacteria bacterium]
MEEKREKTEIATFGGGCFWCTEAIFKRLKGVVSVTSGYTGGKRENPSYEQVSTGATGHAEAIQITFDPNVISYEKLLDVFWNTHDPTTLNQQGADVGTQYRSVLFYHSPEQKEKALRSKEQIEKNHIYNDPIVTEIAPFAAFYTAEEHHQNYYDANPVYPYCNIVISPKIRKLLELYGSDVKEEYK